MLKYEILRLADSTNQLLNRVIKTKSGQSRTDKDSEEREVLVSDIQLYQAVAEHLAITTNFLTDILGYFQHELQGKDNWKTEEKETVQGVKKRDRSHLGKSKFLMEESSTDDDVPFSQKSDVLKGLPDKHSSIYTDV
ncbi:hypothetical protein XU18_0244 [Perkinsela sp. CCAP 1560/4]|nr:hypothetical protein XU18_0244 [Perkinsela sp. CCAP 1560/4]|eukprot:KNH09559.1 hypothetical protein XU18_0244 [Perkinsela sp. CCAP 1560/4]